MEPKIDVVAAGRADHPVRSERGRAARTRLAPLNGADLGAIVQEAEDLRTTSGRTVRLVPAGDADILYVSSPAGAVEMEIRFTASGPVLRFPSAALRLESDGDVDVACHDFRVRAGGSVDVTATGPARLEGHAVDVRSRRTDVRLRANDDVRVEGERILLNC